MYADISFDRGGAKIWEVLVFPMAMGERLLPSLCLRVCLAVLQVGFLGGLVVVLLIRIATERS